MIESVACHLLPGLKVEKKKCRYETLSLCFSSFLSVFLLPLPSLSFPLSCSLLYDCDPLFPVRTPSPRYCLWGTVCTAPPEGSSGVKPTNGSGAFWDENHTLLDSAALWPVLVLQHQYGVSQKKKWRPRKCRYSITCRRPSSSPEVGVIQPCLTLLTRRKHVVIHSSTHNCRSLFPIFTIRLYSTTATELRY